ncbi:MAG: EthD family reductase [Chloroflexi bacterium]|nr:EthD family reductase [Chloroflexota bacterium]
MYKLTILFRTPPDIAKFEDDWALKFVPFVEAMPGVQRIEVSHIDGGPAGPSEFYKMHEVYFETREAMDKAMNSEKGTRAGFALQAIAKGLFTLLFAHTLEDAPRPTGTPPETQTPNSKDRISNS